MKAGFIGLGTLGKTIAKRLVSEGVKLTVWNRTKEKAHDLEAEWAENPAELISQTDIVFLCLFDSAAVAEVAQGEKGLLSGDLRGKIIIDNTTNHFEPVLRFHTMFREKGAFYIEAPVLGSVVPASQGNLTVLASGERSAYDVALPSIQKIGKAIFYLGEPGLATKMKLINNLILGSFMATIAEATVFGESVGLEKQTILDIFAAGAGNSMVLNAKREKLIKEDFSTHFSSALIYKDLHFLQDLAKSLRRPLFTGSAVKELFGMTLSKGIDNLDFSGVYKVLKEL
jgi:3-hydroxyisobutyrate dehydrogenase